MNDTFPIFSVWIAKFFSDLFPFVTDGDQDKENFRWRAIRTHNAGGRKELLRAVRTGEF